MKIPTVYGRRNSITVFTKTRPGATCWFFYGKELLAPQSTPKLEGHPLSAARDRLFNTFADMTHKKWQRKYLENIINKANN
jgi:hypothetical protein